MWIPSSCEASMLCAQTTGSIAGLGYVLLISLNMSYIDDLRNYVNNPEAFQVGEEQSFTGDKASLTCLTCIFWRHYILEVQILAAECDKLEAQQVAETIQDLINGHGLQPQDIAILFRKHAQGPLFEQAMVSQAPYESCMPEATGRLQLTILCCQLPHQ